jgi:hypothetical protein
MCEDLSMRGSRNIWFLSVLLLALIGGALPARAEQASNPEREFIMSCTYGVLAGTLVGAASLAFVDKPGDNLQRVARGASLGLYMGIALGAYTVYILPGQIEKEEEERLNPDKAADGESNSGASNIRFFPFVADSGAGDAASGLGMVFRF